MSESEGHRALHPAEDEHREDTGSGVLRAAVFGISDGLVSNLALVMGVAGGTQDGATVVLAGTAGLLAGAFSMAAGEYVSMVTQRESMERQLELEQEHIRRFPEEEKQHLVALLQESGLDGSTSVSVAERVHQRVERALDFHARLELGIVPEQLGSPGGAAVASFFAFVVGAAIPLLPWLILPSALGSSMLVSGFALLLVGGAVTKVTNRTPLAGAVRQLLFGAAAATVTWSIGRWIGAAV